MTLRATFAVLVLVAAASGAVSPIPSCLPQKTTVASISVKAMGSHYCSNSTQDVQLVTQLLDEVEQGPVDRRCKLTTPQLRECIPLGHEQTNTTTVHTRMIITASMTCDSPCVPHNGTLQSLRALKDNAAYLRNAARQRVSVNLNIAGVDIEMQFFDGHHPIVSTCQDNNATSGNNGLPSLCDCPLQCDKCDDGLYLPPMSSQCQPCPQGTWRKAGLDYSSCVQCPPNTNTASFGASAPTDCVAPVCPQGKSYSECGPVCRPTCTNPTPPDGCPTDCLQGCFCPPNMVEYNGDCIMPSDCTSFTPPPPRPPTIVDTELTSGNIPLTIGYDIRVYEGVNITIDCSPLVQAHGGGNITWHSQLINPRAVIRNEPEQPLPDTSVELVVPSTSIPIFLQESFRCEVCSSHCWSNNSIISVVSIPPPPPSSLPPPTLPPLSCPPGMVFSGCGSACPPSCTRPRAVCTNVCVVGCFCPNGLMEDGGQCVRPEECNQSSLSPQPQFCQLSQDPGPCSNITLMYAYNSTTLQCVPFDYGGCQGNDNRFSTEGACLDACSA